MIENIVLEEVATYKNIVMKPKQINFCYGGNGSGKTTISKVISNQERNGRSKVIWGNNQELPVVVYNKKFIEENFGLTSKIDGIFTLGKESKEAMAEIEKLRSELEVAIQNKDNLSKSKDAVIQKQEDIKNQLEEECWLVQQENGELFKEALSGYRGSKKKFLEKCLEEYGDIDTEITEVNKNDIEVLYKSAYGTVKIEYELINKLDVNEVRENEICELLNESIVGSGNTPIKEFIEYLENSDWIKEGQIYAQKSKNKCPYCQQKLPDNFQNDIEKYFDKNYEIKCNKISEFLNSYHKYMSNIIDELKLVRNQKIGLLNYEKFESKVKELGYIFEKNIKLINEKQKSPATKIKISSLEEIVTEINLIIDEFNDIISKNNNIVQHLKEEQKNVKNQVWQLLLYRLKRQIEHYNREYEGTVRGITAINEKILREKVKIEKYKSEIEEKESQITSVRPTIVAINNILSKFGFLGFKLEENINEKGTYKIIRNDGEDVRDTLSEGEYRFISFLYFYYLVYGSHENNGLENSKVVVIDDPISSLDSNTMFVITNLVKQVLMDCKNGCKGIKQVFVFTHNVYFYKEVTFLGSREEYPTTLTAYWIIKKKDDLSSIKSYEKNPIQTTYKLLWSELKEIKETSKISVLNTMRRILEHYFNVIGGMNYEECINKFEGEDKLICNSLISCINDGSHFISDDFVICFEEDVIDKYLNVFKLIFKYMGHENHYKMMMQEK